MNGPKIIDISPLISPRIAVFPGDESYTRTVSLDFSQGNNLILSSIQTTLHLGAHADGPNHYSRVGVGIHERDLRLYMGTCLVLEARNFRPGARIGWEHLNPRWKACKELPAIRVLIKTGSFPNPERWNSDFCAYSPELIEGLAERGAVLIGIDTPSIDPETSKELESHQTVAKLDLAVLEGLCLAEAKEELYTLIALPLRIENGDSGPVRAVLIEGTGRLDT